jgi:hypothetical protein
MKTINEFVEKFKVVMMDLNFVLSYQNIIS